MAYKESARDVRVLQRDWQTYAQVLRGLLERIAERRRCVWCGGLNEHEDDCELYAAIDTHLPLIACEICTLCGKEIVPRNGRTMCGESENPECYRQQRNLQCRAYWVRMTPEAYEKRKRLKRERAARRRMEEQ